MQIAGRLPRPSVTSVLPARFAMIGQEHHATPGAAKRDP